MSLLRLGLSGQALDPDGKHTTSQGLEPKIDSILSICLLEDACMHISIWCEALSSSLRMVSCQWLTSYLAAIIACTVAVHARHVHMRALRTPRSRARWRFGSSLYGFDLRTVKTGSSAEFTHAALSQFVVCPRDLDNDAAPGVISH